MAIQIVKRKKFKLQKEAVAWAKKQKKRMSAAGGVKWETNRLEGKELPWEAVLFKNV